MLQLSALSSAPSQGMESHSSQQIALRSQWRQLALARGFCLLGRTQSRLWSLKKCSAFPLFLLPMGWGSCWGWLPHPGAFQCAAGWDHRCGQGGVGTSVSGAGTYQRAACAKQSTSFDVLGGRGGVSQPALNPRTQQWNRAELSTKSELAVPAARVEAPQEAQQCRLGPRCAQHQCFVCCSGTSKGLGFFSTWNVLIQRCSGFVLVLCCLLVLQGVGRGWLG